MKTVTVALPSGVPEGGSAVAVVEGRELALFRVNGKVYAIDNICPHRGAPLAEGHLEGGVLTCPWHAWQFNVATGACLTVPASRQRSYAVREEGGEVRVEIPF